ncbi:hypothetical protein N8X76_04600 [Flavobacteriaceae bacterium]|nr:hypothetical protein [Flavobacteriaceae bacterium]
MKISKVETYVSTYKYISNVAYYNTNLLTLSLAISFFLKTQTTNQKVVAPLVVAIYAIGATGWRFTAIFWDPKIDYNFLGWYVYKSRII